MQTPLGNPFQLLDVTKVASSGFATVEEGTQDHCTVNCSLCMQLYPMVLPQHLCRSSREQTVFFEVCDEQNLHYGKICDFVEFFKFGGKGT